MFKVMFVCLGNICRSPMAEFVLRDIIKKEKLDNKIFVASAATSRWEIGNCVHLGTRKKLATVGISTEGKCAVQLTPKDLLEYDMIIGMDSENIRAINKLGGAKYPQKVCKLLDFVGGGDIADPWYTGDFDTTYNDVLKGCKGLIEELKKRI